jgi:hypothetical protein
MINDFSWVLKVLDSCTTENHVITCENLFELFINKWKDSISYDKKIEIVSKFDKIKKGKILSIRKNVLLTL